MPLAIAPTQHDALDIARRGMEGLVRRTRNAHRFDHLVASEEECYAAQGPLRAIHANMDLAVQFGAGTPDQIAERIAALLDDGMADYICFMFPTGDMNYDEARRTLELFVTEVMPELEPSAAASNLRSRLSACPVFEFADAVKELAGEYGSGAVEAEISSQALGFGQTARGAQFKPGRCVRPGRRGLEQSELDVATDERHTHSRVTRDHGKLDRLL